MELSKILRVPRRIKQDFEIVFLTKNWKDLLFAKAKNEPFREIRCRNGVVMRSPDQVALNFLFHEIWLDEFYAPDGYSIKANETVVDIGANIGVFALWAATRAENVRVRSYEPFPKNAEYFVENLNASGLTNIEFHAVAVAGESATRILHVDDSWILHSLTGKDSGEKGVEVECVSLDMVMEGIERCDFLKLDCEGGEYEILYAASDESLRKICRMVCEFNVFDNDQKNGNALEAFLSTKDFTVESHEMLDAQSGIICAKRQNG